jgi:hypothetical protein
VNSVSFDWMDALMRNGVPLNLDPVLEAGLVDRVRSYKISELIGLMTEVMGRENVAHGPPSYFPSAARLQHLGEEFAGMRLQRSP